MRVFAFLLAATMAGCAAIEYRLGPESQPQPGAPKGVVTKHVLAPGKLYPGTPHNYAVYVPAQYDKSKPTAFMIFLDGSGALGDGVRVPVVFDNLIHKKDLPVMIGIFVDPGVLPAAGHQAQSRFERCYQYDSLSDRYSRFLVEELIPEVAKSYNLSKDPNDRGIYGVSTGAVGALVAAWHRPDQFRRVLSLIGTYVAMKGGDTLAATIRRSEPKPLRVFLQAGRNDHIAPNQPQGTFYAGSWPINNQVMYEAFQFAGYDAKLELGDDGHSTRHGAAILPDALRWLWRGYPQPITVKEPAALDGPGWDPRGKVSSVVWADKPWERIREGAIDAIAAHAGIVFTASDGVIYKGGEVFRKNVGHVTAMATAGGDTLYVAADGRLAVYGQMDGIRSYEFRASGLAVTAKGWIYYVDAAARKAGLLGGPAVDLDMMEPSGITLSPDQAMAIITDAGGRFAWSYQIGGDGALRNGEPFYRLEMPETGWMSGIRGSVIDSIGQVYFATPLGIQMCEANGRVAAVLHREGLRGLAFAPGYLYAATDNGLWRRAIKVQGGAWGSLPRPPL